MTSLHYSHGLQLRTVIKDTHATAMMATGMLMNPRWNAPFTKCYLETVILRKIGIA